MKTYKVYRVHRNGRKTLIERHLDPADIGYQITSDVQHYLEKSHGPTFGKEIVKLMKEDFQTKWEYYPEDCDLPTYTIVEEK